MADPPVVKVKATFAGDGTATFDFDPNVVTVTAAGTITFVQKGDNKGDWSFYDFEFCDQGQNGVDDFSVETISAQEITLNDNDADAGDYDYKIAVVQNNDSDNPIWSPDPEVKNQPISRVTKS